QNGLTRRGRGEAIRSSTQQLCAELLLEGCDSASHRDVIHADRLGCARKTPLACRGQKETNVVPAPVGGHRCSLLHIKCEETTMFTVGLRAYRVDLKPMSTEAPEHLPVPATPQRLNMVRCFCLVRRYRYT